MTFKKRALGDGGGLIDRPTMAVFQFDPYDGGAFNYAEKVAVECSQSGFSNVWIKPQNGTTNQAGPFIFDIDPSVDKYIMLNKVKLEMDCHIVREDGSPLQWMDVVAPCDLLGSCFWESVEVFLNGQPFSGASAANAGYKAFMETMLTYDKDAAGSHLQSQFFFQDEPGQYDNFLIEKRTMFRQLVDKAERGEITCTIPLKYMPGPQNEADLKAEEAEDRQKKGLAPRPDTWTPTQLDDERKLQMRIDHVYRPMFAQLLTTGLDALVAGENDKVNKGFISRAAVVRGSERFDMYSPICHDFFRVDNNLGPGNRLQLKLTRHKDPFLINTYLAKERFKIIIDDMRLHLHYIQRRERVRPPIREMYRMNETQLHKQLVNTNAPSITFRVQNGGVIPKSLSFGMVGVRQAEGVYTSNPFHLHHFFLKNISLNINGERYPMSGLEADFDRVNPKIARIFHWGFDNTGASDARKGNLINWNAFMSGCTIITFNLDPDLCNMRHLHNANYGYVDCTIEFARVLPEPIYVLFEKVIPKVVVNDKLSNSLSVLDIEA